MADEIKKEPPIPFECVEIEEELSLLNPKFYREGSKARDRKVNYFFHTGGIGDYICGLPALEYVAENFPHVIGEVYTMTSTVDLFAHILKKHFPRWQVFDRRVADDKRLAGRPTYMPFPRPLSALNVHMLDLGFVYYAGLAKVPEGYNRYPVLDLDFSDAKNTFPEFPAYAVMTPGATTRNRTMKAEAFNGIKNHLLEKGITPIFLGKKEITDIRQIRYEEGYDYSGGVDMREQTTLLQAAGIMSKAKLVVGLDNGLLHLAACTDVPILFGYNIASPVHRRPRRASGNIWDLYPDPKVLPCTFCQSNMSLLFEHDFANCLYRDNKCLDILNDPKLWTDMIDEILVKTGNP